jgi:hypothetical protein
MCSSSDALDKGCRPAVSTASFRILTMRPNRRLELAKRGPSGSLRPTSRAALCSSNAGR